MSTVLQDQQGPDWPLGLIVLVTPGTPVSIMSLVDAALVNDPASPTSATSKEYPPRFNQIVFMGYKAGAGPPRLAVNTGLIYISRKPSGGTADTGVIVKVLAPGETWVLDSAAMNLNVFNPYRYHIDGDTASDGALVTGIVQ